MKNNGPHKTNEYPKHADLRNRPESSSTAESTPKVRLSHISPFGSCLLDNDFRLEVQRRRIGDVRQSHPQCFQQVFGNVQSRTPVPYRMWRKQTPDEIDGSIEYVETEYNYKDGPDWQQLQ